MKNKSLRIEARLLEDLLSAIITQKAIRELPSQKQWGVQLRISNLWNEGRDVLSDYHRRIK